MAFIGRTALAGIDREVTPSAARTSASSGLRGCFTADRDGHRGLVRGVHETFKQIEHRLGEKVITIVEGRRATIGGKQKLQQIV